MEIEQFAPARDFLYLAALLFGIGLGCIINRFRQGKTPRFRNLTVTVGICFFSGTIAALTAAIVYSNWMIFSETALYFPLVLFALLPALAMVFPREAGYPLILVSGVLVVWVGYACLRFPIVDDAARGWVTQGGSGLVQVRLVSPGTDTFLSFQPSAEVVEFRGFSFSLPGAFPIAGGVKRGLVAGIYNDNEPLFSDPRLGRLFFPGPYPFPGAGRNLREAWERFFSFQETTGKLETAMLFPGASFDILFVNRALAFR